LNIYEANEEVRIYIVPVPPPPKPPVRKTPDPKSGKKTR